MPGRVNVASLTGLPGPVHELCQRFVAAGWPDEALPNYGGWVAADALTDVTSGQILGRIGIRNAFATKLETITERSAPYTKQRVNQIMAGMHVLARCNWPVMSVPMISPDNLETLAREIVKATAMRDRKV